MPADREYLTRDDVAADFDVSPRTVDRWVATGQLPAVKVTRKTTRIRRADLDKFIAERTTPAVSR